MQKEDRHRVVLLSSVGKLYNKFVTSGGLVESNLKFLDIIDKLKNSCLEISKEDKEKLDLLYFRLKNEDSIVCETYTKEPLKPSTDFGLIGGNTDAPKNNVIYYKPPAPNLTIEDIKNNIALDGPRNNPTHTSMTVLRQGYYFDTSSAGRLIIEIDHNVSRIRIYNVLGMDITNTFDADIIKGKFVFISNLILTSGKLYLKFN